MKVLVPAMEKRSALAAARSLGKRGIEVIGCSHQKFNPGFASRYCQKKYLYCSPFADVQKYLKDIKIIIEKEKPEVFFPVNEETLLPLLQERPYFEKKIKIPLPANQVLDKVFNKVICYQIAQKLNIPCPKTVERNTFPAIVRPKFSRRIEGNQLKADKLFYALSQKDLSSFNSDLYFLQEYIPGQGFGFYTLFEQGFPRAYFMLKRIHEVPFWGGPSSLRESIWEEKLKEYGLKVLKELNWHGVAMVEFRKDNRDGEFKFIEINPRLWGSLALPVYLDIDFPYLLCQLARGEKIEEKFDYQLAVKSRWLAGEVAYLLSVFFGRKIDWRPSRLKTFWEFFRFFQKDLSDDYFAKDDLKPALVNFLLAFGKLLKKILLWWQRD